MDLPVHTDLPGILDLVHDRTFNLEKLDFDRGSGELTIHLGGYEIGGPYDQKSFVVTDVRDMAIRDRARIGVYTVNEIKVAPPNVRINSNVPFEMSLTIGDQFTIQVTEGVDGTIYKAPLNDSRFLTDKSGLLDMTSSMWFAIERLVFDELVEKVTLPLGYREHPYDQKLLVIEGVTGVSTTRRKGTSIHALGDIQLEDGSVHIKSSSAEVVVRIHDQYRLSITDLRRL